MLNQVYTVYHKYDVMLYPFQIQIGFQVQLLIYHLQHLEIQSI